jgi:hypothetical protein
MDRKHDFVLLRSSSVMKLLLPYSFLILSSEDDQTENIPVKCYLYKSHIEPCSQVSVLQYLKID